MYQDRYIDVPERMTAQVEIISLPDGYMSLSDAEALSALGAAYKAQKVRARACNGQLSEIAGLKTDQP